jgi:hypothetical protein
MATFDVTRFANVDALKRMHPDCLLALLRPHEAYLRRRGLALSAGGGEVDCDLLAAILLAPDDAMPLDLVDALYCIDEMSTPDGMDRLLDEAAATGVQLRLAETPSPTDIAAQVWLADRRLFEQTHARLSVRRRRSFQSFQSRELARPMADPSRELLTSLEAELNDWFGKKKRGRGSRVIPFTRDDQTWFLVRHGEPFRREGRLEESGTSSCVYYRPEKHDVVIYDPLTGELKINAGSPGERDLYRAKFGLHLFGSDSHFPGTAKYTLDPLKRDGAAALVCTDIEGMEWVRLTEMRYLWRGTPSEIEIRQSDDLFVAMAGHQRGIHPRANIIGARFSVKFTNAKTPRAVSIRPSNIADYTRDSDAGLVEQWLSNRGFILAQQADADEGAEPVLVGT